MRFAKWVFLLAGCSGVLLIVPPYFLEAKTSEDFPPPINHPEDYYGFFGVTLAWQVMFVVIGFDPVRYRTAMLPSMLEKARLGFASMDATWLVLFGVAYLWTPREKTPP
jgi:hypothetical protein